MKENNAGFQKYKKKRMAKSTKWQRSEKAISSENTNMAQKKTRRINSEITPKVSTKRETIHFFLWMVRLEKYIEKNRNIEISFEK